MRKRKRRFRSHPGPIVPEVSNNLEVLRLCLLLYFNYSLTAPKLVLLHQRIRIMPYYNAYTTRCNMVLWPMWNIQMAENPVLHSFLGSSFECIDAPSTHKPACVITADFQTTTILFFWPFNSALLSLIVTQVCQGSKSLLITLTVPSVWLVGGLGHIDLQMVNLVS